MITTEVENFPGFLQVSGNELADKLVPMLAEKGITATKERAAKAISLIKERAVFPQDLLPLTIYMFEAPKQYDEKSVTKFWKADNIAKFKELREQLASEVNITVDATEPKIHQWVMDNQYSMGQLMNCLRIAVIGISQGPSIFAISEFIGKAETFKAAFAAHAPALLSLVSVGGAAGIRALPKTYEPLPRISFDYAVMEHLKNVEVVKGDFGWDDVGSYAAFDKHFKRGKDGNIVLGDVKAVETDGCTAGAKGAKIALLGVKDLVVVTTKDAVLVVSKKKVAELKKLFAK